MSIFKLVTSGFPIPYPQRKWQPFISEKDFQEQQRKIQALRELREIRRNIWTQSTDQIMNDIPFGE